MLRVHRYDLRAVLIGPIHHQLAGAHQGLFIGQCNPFALTDRRQGRNQAHHTHHSGEHSVRLLQSGGLHQSLRTGGHPDGRIGQPGPQVGGSGRVHHDRQSGPELAALGLHPLHVPVGGQGSHSHATGGNHFQ